MNLPADGDPPPSTETEAARQLEESLATVRKALTNLRFGGVSITVHDGRVVQIDVTEKKRLRPN